MIFESNISTLICSVYNTICFLQHGLSLLKKHAVIKVRVFVQKMIFYPFYLDLHTISDCYCYIPQGLKELWQKENKTLKD